MKFLFSLFALVILTGSGNSKKEPISNVDETEQAAIASKPSREQSNPKSDAVKDNYQKILVIYQATSRGYFEYISVSQSEIALTNDRSLKTMNSYPCKPNDWSMLKKLIDDADVENLDSLKAPTDKRLYDGAPHATLSIIKGDVEMMTPTFDHGAPPEKIKTLVNKVLSMAENATKQ